MGALPLETHVKSNMLNFQFQYLKVIEVYLKIFNMLNQKFPNFKPLQCYLHADATVLWLFYVVQCCTMGL